MPHIHLTEMSSEMSAILPHGIDTLRKDSAVPLNLTSGRNLFFIALCLCTSKLNKIIIVFKAEQSPLLLFWIT